VLTSALHLWINITIPGADPAVLAVYIADMAERLDTQISSEFTVVVIPIVDMSLSTWQASKRFKSLALLVTLALLVWANLLTGSITGLVCIPLAFVLVLGPRLFNKLSLV
jgi:hypothetical protein